MHVTTIAQVSTPRDSRKKDRSKGRNKKHRDLVQCHLHLITSAEQLILSRYTALSILVLNRVVLAVLNELAASNLLSQLCVLTETQGHFRAAKTYRLVCEIFGIANALL